MTKNTTEKTTGNIADQFITALTELEYARDVERMIALFADDCEVGNVAAPEKFRGIEGARRFWTDYRDNFKDVCSIFRKELYSGKTTRLEWTTEGRIKNGSKVKYEAVSILETEGEKITRFHAYFDHTNLGRQITAHENGNEIRDRLF